MRLLYFPINAAWAFVTGERIEDFNPITLYGFPRFFPSREAAVEAAYYRGLKVDKKGRVTSTGEPPPHPNVVFTDKWGRRGGNLNGLSAATIPMGDCFRWATQTAQLWPGSYVVHGTVATYGGKRIPHAWIEYQEPDEFGYPKVVVIDWQRHTAGLGPMLYSDFLAQARPQRPKRYTPEEALKLSARTKHWGPW